jgi:two-component system, NtrC family, sensor kinase
MQPPPVTGHNRARRLRRRMSSMISLGFSRRAWLATVALVLLAVLVFLFLKTDLSRYRTESNALALLRELRDVDTRRDLDALRLTDALAAAPEVPDRAPIIARILHELDRPGTREAMGPRLAAIRAGMTEKQAAFDVLRKLHAQTLEAMSASSEALSAVVAEGPAAKARDPGAAEAAAALASNAEGILAALRTADIESPAALERAVEARLATLSPMAQATDSRLAAAAAGAERSAREFLRARGAEAEAWRRFAFLTVGARVERATQELSGSMAAALEARDRWRAYLVAYAAALIVGLGYVALRLLAADAALRAANEQLERRVAERTAELTRALRELKNSRRSRCRRRRCPRSAR